MRSHCAGALQQLLLLLLQLLLLLRATSKACR
jgi:hypothetical protein